ncbi:hypothetical protein ASPFODRAFT_459029 [Aspergillus luchuensis CBS 106.47]|uniref:Uncharacterized protein n=1 Tax=Aspergillus luchuensis (strain CBS 106.47) TaxID=1137211 RepID=A0A1M3T133_ASPLC|nr:hypothetical protein ASPFODRAFT_459029 [Aspergillus luchuensis CBS 106.47]
MDSLISFLKHAKWSESAENLYFCDDPDLEPVLTNAATALPTYLRGYGFQAWKVLGRTKIKATNGYIIPIDIITSKPRLLSGPLQTDLVPGCPVPFETEPLITPALYLVLALPPTST